jgi:hypothetical protein
LVKINVWILILIWWGLSWRIVGEIFMRQLNIKLTMALIVMKILALLYSTHFFYKISDRVFSPRFLLSSLKTAKVMQIG